MGDLVEEFYLSPEKCQALADYVVESIQCGLDGKASDLKMIPSFVTSFPTGDETGSVIALDMGGSKVSASKLHLVGRGEIKVMKQSTIEFSKDISSASSSEVFGIAAQCLLNLKPEPYSIVGFTFSYPCNILSINKGQIMEGTKGWKATECIGMDPVELLQNELKKVRLDIRIVSLCNDSVATLVSRAYYDPRCIIGVTLGTGTNACYLEKVSNIRKLHSEVSERMMIVNMEWGAIGDNAPKLLPITDIDIDMNINTPNPGKQLLEKMMSGMYLGELTRLWIVRLYKQNQIMTKMNANSQLFNERMCFHSRHLSSILQDDSEKLVEIASILGQFGITNSSFEDRQVIRQIADLVITRSARLMGTCLHAIYSHLERTNTGISGSVGVDGSVFRFVPGYKARVLNVLRELGRDEVDIGTAVDGPSKGAALIALISS